MSEISIKSMQAAILVEQNTALQVEEVNLPKTLKYGQVLVKLIFSGICGSQIGEIKGVKGPDKYLPHLLGHEGIAEVITIGPGVSTVNASDTVILHWCKGKGIESETPMYEWKGRKLNAGAITTFNQFAVVSENRMTRLNANITPEGAALLGCAVTTRFGVVNNDAKIKIGESIVVLGAGGIGLNVIEGAALCGAYPIIAVDRFDDKLDFCKKFGATHTINNSKENLQDSLSSILENKNADVIVDTTGVTGLIESAYQLTSSNGRVILVGVPDSKANINIHSLPLHLGKSLIGSYGGQSNPSVDIPRYAKLAETGRVKLQELVTEVIEFKNIQTGIDKMMAGQVIGRCIIKF